MTNLPALREAVEVYAVCATHGTTICADAFPADPGYWCLGCRYNALSAALPALLDELEQLRGDRDLAEAVQDTRPSLVRALASERIENAHLREAFVTMERAANQREAEVERLNDELNGTIQLGNQAREQLIALLDELETARTVPNKTDLSLLVRAERAEAERDDYREKFMDFKREQHRALDELETLQEELDRQNSTTHALNLAEKLRKSEAAVVAVRNECDSYRDEIVGFLKALEKATNDLAVLKARTCATCYDHWVPKDEPNLALCGRIGLACQLVGNTCGAWAPSGEGALRVVKATIKKDSI